MEIKGKVHCFFEQSGTFKNEFRKLGYEAEDYDIQNAFGETEHITDLFSEIESAFAGAKSVFDKINREDLIIAFYPCTYFSATSQIGFYLANRNYRKLSDTQKIEAILKRSDLRKSYYDRLLKFVAICLERKIRMIFENPWNEQTYLKANFLKAPDIVDKNRMQRGDYYVKPTAYWFWNCEPCHGNTIQNDKQKRLIMKAKTTSQGSLEKSLMSSDYARNFICDFIIGKCNVFRT